MSLIADALKAAQRQRAGGGDPARQAVARSIVSGAAGPAVPRSGVARTLERGEAPPSRQLRLAAAGFAVASVAAVAFVLVAAPAALEPAPGSLAGMGQPLVPVAGGPDGSVPQTVTEGPTLSELEQEMQLELERMGALRHDEVESAWAEVSRSTPGPATTPATPRGDERAPEPGPATAAAGPSETADPGRRFQLTIDGRGAPAFNLVEEGLAAQRRGDPRAAIGFFRRALEEREDPELLNRLGSAHRTLGELPEARDAFRRAVALRPGFAAAWSNLGVVLLAEGQRREAQLAFAEAVRLDGSNLGARVNLAILHQEQGMLTEARSLLETVLRADGRHAEAHYALGRVLEQEGDRMGAIRHYQQFLAHGAAAFPHLEGPVRERVRQLSGGATR